MATDDPWGGAVPSGNVRTISTQLLTLPSWSLALTDSVFQGDGSGIDLKIISAAMCWNKGLLKERVTLLQIGCHVLTDHLRFSRSLSTCLVCTLCKVKVASLHLPAEWDWFESLCSIVSCCYPSTLLAPLVLSCSPRSPLTTTASAPCSLIAVATIMDIGCHGNILSRFHHQGQGEVLNSMSSLVRWIHTYSHIYNHLYSSRTHTHTHSLLT